MKQQSTMNAQAEADRVFEKELGRLFTPTITQLLSIQLSPSPSFSSLAAYLKLDPLLAGKALHLINSPDYGLNQQFTDLQRAATAVGTGNLLTIILVLALQKALTTENRRDPELVNRDWRITLWAAVSAEAIASHLCPENKRKAFLAGFLKDIALLFALNHEHAPPFLKGAGLSIMPKKGQPDQEIRRWQKTHENIIADVLQRRGMPEDVVEAVRMHHDSDSVSHHSPLSYCVALSNRWAELLYGQAVSPSDIVAFELFLAEELGLGAAQMDCFRSECAEVYTHLLKQLDIQNAPHEYQLYNQSFSNLRDFYFLAQRVLSVAERSSAKAAAETLRHQLRAFWQVETWNLFLSIDGSGSGESFSCEGGAIKSFPASGGAALAQPQGWVQFSISNVGREYGSLSLPRGQAGAEYSGLPVYMHILGMCFDERRRRLSDIALSNGLVASPFIVARVDDTACIRDASKAFLDTFGLTHVPYGRHVGDILHEKLGVSPSRFSAAIEDGQARGAFVSAPEGHFPGTPIYLSRVASPFGSDDSLIQLGDVVPLSTLQTLALSHGELLETLFKNIEDNICLLDAEGLILWADAELEALVGQSLFNLLQPPDNAQEGWTPPVLADITEPVSLRGSLPYNGRAVVRTMHISPLGAHGNRQFLVVMRNAPSRKSKPVIAFSQAAKQRDPLTGLYGYSQFHLLLQHLTELAKKQRAQLGVLFCIMDSLRDINHEHGFQKGDFILSRAADAIASACRPGRDYPCRYGSNKFAVIVTRATKLLLDSMAQSIHAELSARPEEFGKTGIGMVIIAPGQAHRPRIALAREAAKQSAQGTLPAVWAQ